jgi:hypothetical protein
MIANIASKSVGEQIPHFTPMTPLDTIERLAAIEAARSAVLFTLDHEAAAPSLDLGRADLRPWADLKRPLLATDKCPKKSAVAWQCFDFLPVYKKGDWAMLA